LHFASLVWNCFHLVNGLTCSPSAQNSNIICGLQSGMLNVSLTH
jgi:hypothetical protein